MVLVMTQKYCLPLWILYCSRAQQNTEHKLQTLPPIPTPPRALKSTCQRTQQRDNPRTYREKYACQARIASREEDIRDEDKDIGEQKRRRQKCRSSLPMGAVSMTTGGRKDHWFLIMLGGVGPDSVGRPPIMSSANLRNSYMVTHTLTHTDAAHNGIRSGSS